MSKWRKRVEIQLLLLVGLVWSLSFLFAINFTTRKGNCYTNNFRGIEMFWDIETSGWLAFLKRVSIGRQEHETIMYLLKQPLFFSGLGINASDMVFAFLFPACFAIGWYLCFRFFATAWQSFLGALAMMSTEIILKSLMEYDTYQVFHGIWPIGLALTGFKLSRKRTHPAVDALLVISYFLCIATRPFESFFFTLAAVLICPRILKERAILTGLIVGGLWWLLNPEVMWSYWQETRLQPDTELQKNPSRFFTPITCGILTLAFSAFFSARGREFLKHSAARIALASAFLTASVLFLGNVGLDDYHLTVLLGISFVCLGMIFASERVATVKPRSGFVGLLVALFFSAQYLAFARPGSLPLGISVRVINLDPLVEDLWMTLNLNLDPESKHWVAMVFSSRFNAGVDIRPIWSRLRLRAIEENKPIRFSFPEGGPYTDRYGLDEFCRRKFTHVLVFDPIPPVQSEYLYEFGHLTEDIDRNMIWLADSSTLPSIDMEATSVRLYLPVCF